MKGRSDRTPYYSYYECIPLRDTSSITLLIESKKKGEIYNRNLVPLVASGKISKSQSLSLSAPLLFELPPSYTHQHPVPNHHERPLE